MNCVKCEKLLISIFNLTSCWPARAGGKFQKSKQRVVIFRLNFGKSINDKQRHLNLVLDGAYKNIVISICVLVVV